MSSNETQLLLGREATRSASPVGAYNELAFSGETLTAGLQTTQSNLISGNRMVQALVNIGIDVGGELQSEFSELTFDDLMEGAACNPWTIGVTEDTLTFGGTEDYTWTILKRYGYLANNDERVHQFQGMQVASMTLSATDGEIVGANFGFGGSDVKFPTDAEYTALATSINAASPSNSLNACSDLANIQIGGAPISSIVQSVTVNITNSLRSLAGLGQCTPQSQAKGITEISGTITAFHDSTSESWFRQAINSTENSLSFEMAGPTKVYKLVIPVFLSSTNSAQASGSNTDNTIELNYTAIRDNVYIERSK